MTGGDNEGIRNVSFCLFSKVGNLNVDNRKCIFMTFLILMIFVQLLMIWSRLDFVIFCKLYALVNQSRYSNI